MAATIYTNISALEAVGYALLDALPEWRAVVEGPLEKTDNPLYKRRRTTRYVASVTKMETLRFALAAICTERRQNHHNGASVEPVLALGREMNEYIATLEEARAKGQEVPDPVEFFGPGDVFERGE